jgi:hypothetical protein
MIHLSVQRKQTRSDMGSAYLPARPWPMLSFLWWYPLRSSNSAVKTLYKCGVELLIVRVLSACRPRTHDPS